jgi:lysozyme
MKKRFYLALSALAISTALTIPVFAGTWKQDNTGWWYERDDKSFPVSVWEQIDGSWYYFNENGYMLSNQWFGNYYLGSTGAMLTNTVVDGYQ